MLFYKKINKDLMCILLFYKYNFILISSRVIIALFVLTQSKSLEIKFHFVRSLEAELCSIINRIKNIKLIFSLIILI